jgi:hypothetical protein
MRAYRPHLPPDARTKSGEGPRRQSVDSGGKRRRPSCSIDDLQHRRRHKRRQAYITAMTLRDGLAAQMRR